MAKFIPDGWVCSPAGGARYRANQGIIEAVVAKRASKYNLDGTGLRRDDMCQEGRMAAMYACDRFQPGRGKLINMVGVIVENALAMVAAEALAQRRQAHTWEQDGRDDSGIQLWRRVPSKPSGKDVAEVPGANSRPDARSAHAAERFARLKRVDAEYKIQQQFRAELSLDAQAVLDIRLTPPPELLIMSRNDSGRRRPLGSTTARYLGWKRPRLDRAVKELRQAATDAFKTTKNRSTP